MPAPVANFTAAPLAGDLPLRVVFTDTSTNAPTSWLWDFGDGYTSTEQNPAHGYTAAGIYTVALAAINGSGSDSETKTGYITITETAAVFGEQVTEISRLYLGRGIRGEPFGSDQIEISVDLLDLGEELDVALDYLGHLQAGPLADMPVAALTPIGSLYAADDGVVYQSDGTDWNVWATLGGSTAGATQVWMPLFDSDGAAVLDSDEGVIPTLISIA